MPIYGIVGRLLLIEKLAVEKFIPNAKDLRWSRFVWREKHLSSGFGKTRGAALLIMQYSTVFTDLH